MTFEIHRKMRRCNKQILNNSKAVSKGTKNVWDRRRKGWTKCVTVCIHTYICECFQVYKGKSAAMPPQGCKTRATGAYNNIPFPRPKYLNFIAVTRYNPAPYVVSAFPILTPGCYICNFNFSFFSHYWSNTPVERLVEIYLIIYGMIQ